MSATAIKSAVYQSLEPAARIMATIAALSRDDTEEVGKLMETCPRKSYSQPDAAFLDSLQKLQTLALATESDLQTTALDWLMAMRLE
jgi:hypothetical protein